MSNQEIKEKIVDIIMEIGDFDREKVLSSESLMDDLDLSSLEIMTMFAEIESTFEIKVDEDEIRQMISLDDVVTCVEKLVS